MKKDSLEARYEQIVESAHRALSENAGEDDISVGQKVKVEVSSGSYDYRTGMETKRPTYAIGVVQKISKDEASVHANDYQIFYTVKYKNPLSNRVEVNKFTFVTPI
jgi:hypothetical protein